MSTTFGIIFLGNIADLDPFEGNGVAENAGTIVGSTFGSSGDPLYDHTQTMSVGTTSYTGGATHDAYDTDNFFYDDQFTVDGGGDQTMDAVSSYDATITYLDGTTATISAVLFQDTSGNFYFAPEMTANGDQTVLEAQPIQSLTLDVLVEDSIVLGADRVDWDFAEVVDGTTGNDAMTAGYTDGDGDQIGGIDGDNEWIYGYGGDDTITGGAGNDTIDGGIGDDTIAGGAGDDVLHGDEGFDTFLFSDNWGSDTVYGGAGTGFVNEDTLDFSDVTAGGVTVTLTGSEDGTATQGSNSVTFDNTEHFIGTDLSDSINATADNSGLILEGGGGDDTIIGGGSGDEISGGTGADSLKGSGGDDTFALEDNFGNDTVFGGETGEINGDTMDASQVTTAITVTYSGTEAGTINDGTSTASFTEIENFILGRDNDLFTALSNGTDLTVDGGAGDDTITGGYGTNTLFGGDDSDTFNVGYHIDHITGGEGGSDFDTMSIKAAEDAIDITFTGDEAGTYTDSDGDSGSFSEIEAFELSSHADTLDGSASNASITVDAGAGADLITGGGGDDDITGGTGDDTISGGGGDDTFTYVAGDGADTITDFNSGNSGTLSDGDSSNNDFIDLSGFYDNIRELHADQADDGVLNQSNDGVDGVEYSDNTQFGPSSSLTFTGGSADGTFFTVENTGVICFARGTWILTPDGEVEVQKLRVGGKVMTQGNGPQKIRWIGSSRVRRRPNLQPIRIAKDALGEGIPNRTLHVSPQHRMLIRSPIVERMTGTREVFVAAKKLTDMPGICADTQEGYIHYFHILCDAHEIISANGAPAETLLPGPQAQQMMGPEAWEELTSVFPAVHNTLALAAPVRPVIRGKQKDNLTRRHRSNGVALVVPVS